MIVYFCKNFITAHAHAEDPTSTTTTTGEPCISDILMQGLTGAQ